MQLRTYILIKKIGLIIIGVGSFTALLGFIHEFYIQLGFSIIILGLICVFFGWIGIGDEKQKLEKEKIQ